MYCRLYIWLDLIANKILSGIIIAHAMGTSALVRSAYPLPRRVCATYIVKKKI